MGHGGQRMTWLLAACTPKNDVEVDPELVPFEVREIDSALFLETGASSAESGQGVGMLLMSDDEVSCEQYEAAFGDSYYTSTLLAGRGSLFSDSIGLVVIFSWSHDQGENAGWEGDYAVFSTAESERGSLERGAWVLPFADGQTWLGRAGGYARIDDNSGSIEGHVETRAIEATFDAEYCGKMSGDYYAGHSGR